MRAAQVGPQGLQLIFDRSGRMLQFKAAEKEAKPLVRDALAGAVDVRDAASLEEAVENAFALAQPSGVVLFAPACSSFDMFADYAERGRKFKEHVARLA